VAVLGLLVLVRTFLSWTLAVEIEGRWPLAGASGRAPARTCPDRWRRLALSLARGEGFAGAGTFARHSASRIRLVAVKRIEGSEGPLSARSGS